MQQLITKSVEVSGYDLIVTDLSGNKQTIKDGLSSLFMGELQLVSPSGEQITHDHVINSLNGTALGLDSVFFEDLIQSGPAADAEKAELGSEPKAKKEEQEEQEEQDDLAETLAELQAQVESYKELVKEAMVKEAEASEVKEEVQQPKEIKDDSISEQLSQQLRPEEQAVDTATSQTASKPESSSSSSDSSSQAEAGKAEASAEQAKPVLFISGSLDKASDTGVEGDSITSAQKPTFTGTATPGAKAVLTINGQTYDLNIDEKGAWSFTLPAELEDGSYSYELKITDPKTGEESSIKQNVTVDTTASFINAGLAENSDTGSSATDGITNQSSPTLTGKVEPNSKVTIKFGDYSWTMQTDATGSWEQPLPEKLEDGEYTYTVTVVDAAGNESSKDFTFKVDTSIELEVAIDNVKAGEETGAYKTNDSKPDFSGLSEPGSTISLTINNKTYTTIVDENGHWAISVPGSLADGSYDYVITAVDAAGNQAQSSGSLEIKATAPELEIFLDNDSGEKGDWITKESSPVFSVKTEAGSTVVITVNGQKYTAVADDQGIAKFDGINALEDGTHAVTIEVTDSFGNVSTSEKEIVIDTATPDIESGLSAATDTGINSTDGITNNTKPVLNGVTEPGATVTIIIQDKEYKVTADQKGRWSFEVEESLGEGTHSYTVVSVDKAGNETRQDFTFEIDASTSLDVSIMGAIEGDNESHYLSNQSKPQFGGISEAGSTIILSINGKEYTTIVGRDGQWAIKLPDELADSTYQYTVTVIDIAGNKEEVTGQVEVNTKAPDINLGLAQESDSAKEGDWITNQDKPTFTLQTAPGSTVKLVVDGKEYTATVGENGSVSFDIEAALEQGEHEITVEVTDRFGNVSTATETVTIDTSLDFLEASLAAESDTGTSSTDNLTRDESPTLVGVTEPYATVVIKLGAQEWEVKADAHGKWKLELPEDLNLDDGTHQYTVTSTDVAGNTKSDTFEFTLDTKVELSASLTNAAEKDGKYVTNQNTLVFEGKSDPGSTITLMIGGHTYTTTAKNDGSWSISLDEPLENDDYEYTITATDAAGNFKESEGSVSINSEGPEVIVELADDSDSGVKDDWITNSKQPVVAIQIPEGCEIKVMVDGKEVEVSLSEDGKYLINFDQELVDDTYPIHIEVTDQYGNITVVNENLVIDTQAPEIEGGVNSSFDTGESNEDGITSNKKPMLSGTTEPNANVKITFADGKVVEVKSDAEGNWNYQIPTELEDGTYAYTVEVSDAAGNTKQESFEFTVDTKITLSAKLDPSFVMSNTSNDYSTNSVRPNLSGQTDPGAKVVVVCGNKTYETIADEQGKWVVTLTQDAKVGENSFTVTSTDAAGNTTSTESKFVYIPDGVIPPYVTVELDKDSDTGKQGDNITSDKRPKLTGTANPGLTVVIKIGEQEFTTKADDEGNWSFEFNTDLPEGLNEYTVTVLDPDTGLTSSASSSVFVDTGAPAINIALEDERDTGTKGDFVTKNRWPVFTGKSEPNSEVTITLGDVSKTVTTDAHGNWTLAWPNEMGANSTNHFKVTITDVAGNKTESSVNLVVDNRAPHLDFIGLNDESDTGAKDQVWTSLLTATLEGTAEPGATITIAQGKKRWTVKANEQGKWEFKIPDGYIPDNGREQSYTFTVTATDAAGNSTSQQKVIHFHKKHGFKTTVEMSSDTDSDTKGDWVTTSKRPSFNGVIDLNGGGYVSQGTLTINGKDYPINIYKQGGTWKWTCSVTDDLPTGELKYVVTIHDSWGNVTTSEGKVTISNLSASLDDTSDSAELGDKITNDNTPKLSGTCTPGAVVRVEIGNKVYSATVNSDGTWSVEIPELTDGEYSYKVTESINGVTSSWIGEVTIDTKNESVTAQVTKTGTAENTTNNANPTLTGTGEPGSKITIVVAGKTYHTTVQNNGTWSVALTGANLDNGTHKVTVTSTDKAGNEAKAEISIVVDKKAPELQYGSTEEALQSQGACSINSLKPVLIGKGEAGTTIKITVGGQTVTTTVESDGTWRLELPQLNGNVQGEHRFNVTIEAIDAAGNVTKVTTDLVYDNATQDDFDISLAESSMTGEDGLTNNKTPTLTGKVEAGATVTITIDHQTFTVKANEKGEWSYKLPELDNGKHTVSVSYTDKAGNKSDEKEFTFEVNNTPISVEDTTELNNGHNHYSGTDHTLKGKVSVGCKVIVTINGEKHTATVDEEGNWTLPLKDLEDKVYNYTVTATDKFGNTNTTQGSFVIDNDAPETTCVLATDSGTRGDNITNVKNPVFTGKTEPGAEVTFKINNKEYKTTAGEDGRWQITVTDALPEQEHKFTVTVVDKAGNKTETAFEGEVTVSATNNETVTEVSLSDKVDQDNDNITNNKSPQLQGKAPAHAVVVVTIAGNKYEAKANENGEWTLNIPGPLADAKYDYTVQVKDEVGNLGPAVSGSFTVDSSTKVTINGVVHEDETHAANNMTNTSMPTLTGTAEPGSKVVVTINGVKYEAEVAENGTWTVTINNALDDKTYVYTVTTTDKAGNTAQAVGSVTVDTSKPLVNEAGLTDESETGIAGSNITKFDCPTFEGVTEPNATVILKIGGETYTFQAKENGHWEFTIPEDKKLSDDTYEYTVEVIDQAGNKCDTTVEGQITVSATKPSASASLQADTNTGGKEDMVTSNQKPTLCGKSKPGSIVVVTINDVDYLAEVDSNGAWKLNIKNDLPEGSHDFTVKVVDQAGNTNTESGKITIDLTAPTQSEVSINESNVVLEDTEHDKVDTVDNKLINDLTPKFEGKTEPFATVQLTIDGHTYSATANAKGEWSLEVTHSLANEEHHYSLVTTDQAGNQSVAFGSLTVDNQIDKPEIDNTMMVGMDKVQLMGEIDADVVKVSITIGDETFEAVVKDGLWSVEIDEELYKHNEEFVIEATDQAGNTVTTEGTFDREINAPEVDEHLWVGGDQVKLIGSADLDITSIKITVDSKEYEATIDNGRWSVDIPQNEFDKGKGYTITAVDKAGNVSSNTIKFEGEDESDTDSNVDSGSQQQDVNIYVDSAPEVETDDSHYV
ncbi:TPA: Ig-like domain-containing protein [Vibrio cholerae]